MLLSRQAFWASEKIIVAHWWAMARGLKTSALGNRATQSYQTLYRV